MNKTTTFNVNSMRGRVYAITSGKGGVGKTSIAVNLSIALAKAGKRVLLIDADMGLANVDLMTGVSVARTIEDVLTGKASIFDVLVDGPGDITILPASSALGKVQESGNIGLLKKELVKLENAFEFIFIDTGAGISANVVDFVFMAEEVIVVMTPEPTAFADAYAMVKLVTIDRPDIDIGVIVNTVTKEDEAQRIYGKFNEIVKRFLGKDVRLRGGVVRDPAVAAAIMRQVPLALSTTKSPAMQSIVKIARNLLGMKNTKTRSNFSR